MTKYEPLSQFLGRLEADYWRPTFLELERILEFKLPPSARKNAAWWSKESRSARHAHAWADVGWKVQSVDLDKERVTFVRSDDAAAAATGIDEGLAHRLRDHAESLGDWVDESRQRAGAAVRARPAAATGVSAGLAFAAGVGLGYLLFRAVGGSAATANAERRARDALILLADKAHHLADGVAERVRTLASRNA
jgi:hypothetical protein